MRTVAVLIGNSDDRLSQAEWAKFVFEVDIYLRTSLDKIQFTGFSDPRSPWQNACWVGSLKPVSELEAELARLAKRFKQDSIAVVVGESHLVMKEGDVG